jgi:hypothetical protein
VGGDSAHTLLTRRTRTSILLLAELLEHISAGTRRATVKESTARVELKTNERNHIDTRSGLAVANSAGLDGLPSKDQPVRVVFSEKCSANRAGRVTATRRVRQR